MSGLTIMQARALDAIRAGTIGGVSPSYAEIADRLGLATRSGVHRLVTQLEGRGKIRRRPNSARSLEIVGEETFVPLTIQRLRAMPLKFLTEEIGHAAGVLSHRLSRLAAAALLRRLADRIVGGQDAL